MIITILKKITIFIKKKLIYKIFRDSTIIKVFLVINKIKLLILNKSLLIKKILCLKMN